MDKALVKRIQQALLDNGYDPKGVDGIIGPNTERAIVNFKRDRGLAARPYLGPITLSALLGVDAEKAKSPQLPWVNEMTKHMGEHEVYDNEELRKWLRSDGSTLGDPAKLPWCGDCMETAIRLSLPDEWPVTDARLVINPYWADNWRYFGKKSPEAYGALATFKRPGGNHIAILVGIDPLKKRYRVRGGNQSNRVSDTWIDMKRNTSIRRPATWNEALPKLPVMNSEGQIVSTNEA